MSSHVGRSAVGILYNALATKSLATMQNLLLSFILFGLSHATVITNETSALQTSYEFIVIGGGTTGLAVANRLSVNHTVLVVEQGADMMNSELINDPFTPFGT